MVSPTDGVGGTGSDSGVTSPSPPSTSRQGVDDLFTPVDPHDVSTLPEQLPPPNNTSTPLKVDCNNGAHAAIETESRSSSPKEDDLDNELAVFAINSTNANEIFVGLLADNQRLLQRQMDLQVENNGYRDQIGNLNSLMQQWEDRLAASEQAQKELIDRICIEKEDAHRALLTLQKQVDDGKKFTEDQLAEHEQDRAVLQAENDRLRDALVKANQQLASTSSATDGRISISVDLNLTAATQTDATENEQSVADAFKQKLLDKENELADQERNGQQLQCALDDANERVQGLTAELSAKCDHIAQLKESVEDLQIQIGDHVRQKKDLEDEKANLIGQVQQRTRELKGVERKNSDLQLNRLREDALVRDNDELKLQVAAANASLKQINDAMNETRADLRTIRMERDKYKTEADHLRQTVNHISSGEEGHLRVQLENAEAELRSRQSEIDRMIGQLEAVKDVHIAFDAQKALIFERDRHVKDLEHTMDLTIREKEELSKQRQQLQETLFKEKEEYDRLEREYQCFKENAEIQYNMEKLFHAQFQAQAIASSDNGDLRAHLETIEAEKRTLQVQMDQMTKQLESLKDLKKAFGEQKLQLSEREKAVKDLENALDLIKKEKEHLAKQRQRLEDAYCLLKQDHERRARDFRSLQENAEMEFSRERADHAHYETQAVATINSLQTAFEEEKERAERLEKSNRHLNRRVEELRRLQVPDDALLIESAHMVTRLTKDVTDKVRELRLLEHARAKLLTKDAAWRGWVRFLLTDLAAFRRTEEMMKTRMARFLGENHAAYARLLAPWVPTVPKRRFKSAVHTVVACRRLLNGLPTNDQLSDSFDCSRPGSSLSSISKVCQRPLREMNKNHVNLR